MPRRKSSGFPHLRHGIPADPSAPASLLLLRWRASAPPLVHGDRLQTDGGIHGDASHAGVSFGPCRVVLTSRPRREKWCGRRPSLPYYIICITRLFRRRRANNDGDRTPSVLSPSLALEGTRRRRRRQGQATAKPARSKGPAICRKAGRGVTLRRRACPATWRQSCRLCRPRRPV